MYKNWNFHRYFSKKNIENAIFCPKAKNGWNSKLIHGLGLEFITEPIENMKCMKKMWLQCCLWLLNIVNFLNFATLRPYISKTWGHAKNFIFCSTSSKSAQKCIGIKKDYNFFYYLTPITKFCPLAKDCRDPKFIPDFFIVFFYSLDPLLSEFKIKIRGEPFAYRCYSSSRTKYDITP